MRLKQKHRTLEARFASGRIPRSIVGARQFWQFESDGTEPDNPDPYYLDLRGGKMGRHYAITEMAKSFFGTDWFGWDFIERHYTEAFVRELRAALGVTSEKTLLIG